MAARQGLLEQAPYVFVPKCHNEIHDTDRTNRPIRPLDRLHFVQAERSLSEYIPPAKLIFLALSFYQSQPEGLVIRLI